MAGKFRSARRGTRTGSCPRTDPERAASRKPLQKIKKKNYFRLLFSAEADLLSNSGSTQCALQSSCVGNRLSFPSHPPYQNREHPPYSMSKNHLTVKLRQEPRSLSNPHTCPVGTRSSHPPNCSSPAELIPSGQHPKRDDSQEQPSNCGP